LLSRRSPRAFFFRNLSNRAGYALTAVIVLVWLAGATAALPWFSRGTPGDPIPGCRWTLDNHGAITCVSHATYLHAEAALQRFVAGVFAFFYTIHLGAAAAELVRRRSENV
jgi:hypothetical protein